MGTLRLAARRRAAESWEATKESREAETMQSHILVALFLTLVLAQEEPETRELLGSRRKINLVNNVLHSTVRKILRPYRNKIPRTFTKHTRVYHGHGTGSASYPSYPDPIPFPSDPSYPDPIPFPADPIPFPSYPTFPQPPGVVPSQTPTGSLTLDETP